MIPIFFVYGVKADFRLKARMAAGGHVLPPPLESVCSGVVSLCGNETAMDGDLSDMERSHTGP